MKPLISRPFRTLVLVALLAGLAISSWYHFRFYFSHNTIQQLDEIPVGNSVRLAAVVTAVDPESHRFWVQDDTGALALAMPAEGRAVEAGEFVGVEAVKTAPYDAELGPDSMALRGVTVLPLSTHAALPPPVAINGAEFPTGGRSGVRVEMAAVVRAVTADDYGRAHLAMARTQAEVDVIVPGKSSGLESLINAQVSIAGVPEVVRSGSGQTVERRLYADSRGDLRVTQPAPAQTPLETIRQIYSDPAVRAGHRLRVRGRIAAWSGENLLLEDPWGAIECRVAATPKLPAGSAVEVNGFPGANTLRIDLFRGEVTAIPASELPQAARSEGAEVIGTVAAVRALPQARASLALPVRIAGVVTHNDPDWGQMYVQDPTGGIYIKYSGVATPLRVGEKVTVVGVTNAGDFAPVIVGPKFEDAGDGRLPDPEPVTGVAARSGMLDSQLVEVRGIIHPIQPGTAPGHLRFALYTDFGQVQVFTVPQFPLAQLLPLEDARVSIRGVFGTLFNSRRQLVGYQLNISDPGDIDIIESANPDPYSLPVTPIGALLHFSRQASFGHRVKVAGTVTMVSADSLYLQDASGGVQVRGDAASLHRGDVVEALGYPSLVGRYSPVLMDAVFQWSGRNTPAAAIAAPVESLLQGQNDSELVTVEGKLLAAVDEPGGKSLLLQAGVHTFTAEMARPDAAGQRWQPEAGSVLRLTGISSAQVDPDKLYLLLQQQPVSFRILMRSPADVELVKPAPFWNLRNATFLIATFALAILAALMWGNMQLRRVRAQRRALRKAAETNRAIADLSRAVSEVSSRRVFDEQVSVRGTPEIARLVVGFNGMLEELHRAELANRDAETRLQRQAVTDELTGLPNRRHLAQHLSQSLASAQRHDSLMALLYIDLDGFKLVNDSLGHAAGDSMLIEVAHRLTARARKSDSLARIGGDEFTIILNRIGRKEDAQTVADSVLAELGRPFHIAGQEITISASIGICLFPDGSDGSDGETDLLRQADSAMYAAKRSGRNRAMFFTGDLGEAMRERLTLENELRRALVENRDISVHFQPEFELSSGRLTRFEALARWTNPTLGAIPPSTFIPIAEESGLIHVLGAWIMDRACTEAVAWQEAAGWPIQVAVNVSSAQFARDSFVGEVTDILRKTGLDPHLLQIELTESAMLIGVERAARSMQTLRELGVSFAIDDFGTGYSCLSYLPELHFDALKVDREFVKDLIRRPETRAMVRSLVSLAQELGMRSIFEGVETAEQLALVETMGGDEAQGYLLGRPTPDPAPFLGQTLTVQMSV